MTRLHVTATNTPAPGDIRALGRGDVVFLHPSIRNDERFSSILCALPNAIARGASVRWKE